MYSYLMSETGWLQPCLASFQPANIQTVCVCLYSRLCLSVCISWPKILDFFVIILELEDLDMTHN